jgi:CheY-like chemotaxis protein
VNERRTVVVVDDDPWMADVVERSLQEAETVDVAPRMNFERALTTNDWSPYWLALVDLAWPARQQPAGNEPVDEHQGCLVARHIRRTSRSQNHSVRIVVLTGQEASFDNDLVRLQLRREQIDGFIARDELPALLPDILTPTWYRPIETSDRLPDGVTATSDIGRVLEVVKSSRLHNLVQGKRRTEQGRERVYRQVEKEGRVVLPSARKSKRVFGLFDEATRILGRRR